MESVVKVSCIPDSLSVYPKDDKTTIFQLGLVINNPSTEDFVSLKSEIEVHSSFNWFSKSLHHFTVVCDAGFCVVRESTFQEIFHFSLHQEFVENEQKAFYEIINETKDLHETLKFKSIKFQLSDGTSLSAPIHLTDKKNKRSSAFGKN